MNKGLSLAFAFVLVSVSIGEPQFEIRDGDCIKVVPADLVMSRHVNLAGIPSMSREDKVWILQFYYSALVFIYISCILNITNNVILFVMSTRCLFTGIFVMKNN